MSTTSDSSKDPQDALLWQKSWKTGSRAERTLGAPAGRKAGGGVHLLLGTGAPGKEISLEPVSQHPGNPALPPPPLLRVVFPSLAGSRGSEAFLRHFSVLSCARTSFAYSSPFRGDALLSTRKKANGNSLILSGLSWD